jgi:ankyrin repeat protein
MHSELRYHIAACASIEPNIKLNMRYLLICFLTCIFTIPAWAETPTSAFEETDVPAALHKVFGSRNYLATDKVKIQHGQPGRTKSFSESMEEISIGWITLSIDMPGPKKIALLMESMRNKSDSPTPLLAIYTLSGLTREIVIPVNFPYVIGRITAVVEVGGKLLGAQESFHIFRSSDSYTGRELCDDKPREKLPRFTPLALDNMAMVSASNNAGVPLISVSMQHEMNWEPVLNSMYCTVAAPRAIRSAQLVYDGEEIVAAEWGTGVAQASLVFALPSAQAGKPLLLRWQDLNSQTFKSTSTVPDFSVYRPNLYNALNLFNASNAKYSWYQRNATIFGDTPLHAASFDGDLDSAKRLLAAGANVNATLPNGWTALGLTIARNHPEVAVYLLDHGADPNIQFQYADTALIWAVYQRNPALVTALLARGANGNNRDRFGNNLFTLAVYGDSRLASDKTKQQDYLKTVKILISHGLIDQSDATVIALQMATTRDDYEVIKALIESGFNPAAYAGETPLLIWAVKYGYTDIIATMLTNGAQVNVESSKCETPLLAALYSGNSYGSENAYRLERERKAIVEILLKHGAKPSYKNKHGIDAFKAAESLNVNQKNTLLKLMENAD